MTPPAQAQLREAPGHWSTDEGRELAGEYLGRTRESLCMGELPDFVLANEVFMVGRNDLELIVYQTAAKERIRWLSAQLAQALEAQRETSGEQPHPLGLTKEEQQLSYEGPAPVAFRQPTPAADGFDYGEPVAGSIHEPASWQAEAPSAVGGVDRMREALEMAAQEAERIGIRWAEDSEHPVTSRRIGKDIAAAIRDLSITQQGERSALYWVIERRCDPPQYAKASRPMGFGDFTQDIQHAHRRDNRQHAVDALRSMPAEDRAECFISEHMDIELPSNDAGSLA